MMSRTGRPVRARRRAGGAPQPRSPAPRSPPLLKGAGRAIGRSRHPMVSQSRSETAKRNGSMSRGPKTPEGKARSRANSVAHSMTGEGVVLTDEVRDAADAYTEALLGELKP